MPLPPPPKKSNTGLVLGLVGGFLAVALVCGGGGLLTWKALTSGDSGSRGGGTTRGGDPSATASAWSPSATPSQRQTVRQATLLDSSTTDTTPFQLTQFFHESTLTDANGKTMTLSASGFYSACENVGGTKTKTLMKANECGSMAVAVYLTQAKDVMVGMMVIPLPDSAKATAVVNGVKNDESLRGDMNIWCPRDPEPGAKLCKTTIGPNTFRYISYLAFHRYALLSVELYTDGRTTGTVSDVSAPAEECFRQVQRSIQTIY